MLVTFFSLIIMNYAREWRIPSRSPEAVRDTFVSYIWKAGGSLPLTPTPIVVVEGDAVGAGCVRRIPMVGLEEEIVSSVGEGAEGAEGAEGGSWKIVYRVRNPSWRVCYPVEEEGHRGSVTFRGEGGGTVVEWKVETRPLMWGWWVVSGLTSSVIGKLGSNLVRQCGQD